MCTQMFLHIITATLLSQIMAHWTFAAGSLKRESFQSMEKASINLNHVYSNIFSGVITATLLAQLIVRLTFNSGGLEVIHQTIFLYFFFFLRGTHRST